MFFACDGFENAAVDGALWPFVAGDPLPTKMRQARGKQSLEIRAPDVADGGPGSRLASFVARSHDLSSFPQIFGRAFFFVPSAYAPDGGLLYFYSSASAYPGVDVRIRQGLLVRGRLRGHADEGRDLRDVDRRGRRGSRAGRLQQLTDARAREMLQLRSVASSILHYPTVSRGLRGSRVQR